MSRISGTTESHHLQVELDVNTDIYPVKTETFYGFVLANSLTEDGAEDFDLFRSQAPGADSAPSLIDQYQYVMNGKIFEDQLSDDGETL